MLPTHLALGRRFVDFVNASPTAFHAVDTSKKILNHSGFKQLSEKDKWTLEPNGKYYFTRNQSTIVAFAVGGKWKPGNGLNMLGAHTDSPHLELKPNSLTEANGYLQVAIQTYGGGLWTTWFDRDLTIAGRVLVKRGETFVSELVHIQRPILRVPTLAIHLDRDSGNKLEFNKQTQLLPILATSIANQLNESPNIAGEKRLHPPLLHLLAEELKVSVADIKDFDLSVVDTQPAGLGGIFSEFIFSPRLDNLMMSFCGLTGLIESLEDPMVLKEETNVWALALFDHEEVGSESSHGAASPIVSELVKRISGAPDLVERATRQSFLISADMAHALHPNYADKHESGHKPALHKGVVIKTNTNQRYATTLESGFIIRELATRNNIPFQEFVVRNDVLCGSTIGPIISSRTGIRTVDIGNPQLSMHSIREMCGTSDVTHAVNLIKAFYSQFTKLDSQIKID